MQNLNSIFSIVLTLTFVCTFGHTALAENATLQDVTIATYGESIYQPSPESALGRYLTESGASTVLRRFLTAPEGNEIPPSEPGDEKLVVAVSPRSFQSFLNHFGGRNYLYHVHTPSQSTLRVAFNGRIGSYAQLSGQFRYLNAGTMMIPIMLADSESSRVNNYFNLGLQSEDAALYPWYFTDSDNQPYSPVSGWTGCTFWFGNIPMGDQQMNEYSFASGPDDADGSRPNTGVLRVFNRFANDSLPSSQMGLAHQVWSAPGHQLLAEVLDVKINNLRGEFANPGWVAYTLLGSVSANRVPIVFLLVDDETRPIDPNFDLQISPSRKKGE